MSLLYRLVTPLNLVLFAVMSFFVFFAMGRMAKRK
jgi:hypothetical protein